MITIGIASIPSREKGLELVLDSLTNQADRIYVSLNGYDTVPDYFEKYSNVCHIITDNSLGDAMKFHWASMVDGYYLTCDDDLIYPPDYCCKMINGVNYYDCIVSLHGRQYASPVTDFMKWIGSYPCLKKVTSDISVNIIGDGCCAFHTNDVRVDMESFKRPNMSNIFFSKIATEQNVPMIVLEHEADYLTYIKPPKRSTIWERTKDYNYHLEVMNTFI
jgi:hypothetical protein